MEMLITIIILVVLIWLIKNFRSLYHQTRLLKKIRPRIFNIAAFDNGFIDCYVKFSGRIKSKNTLSDPEPCAVYTTTVWGLWHTKKKKPDKGVEEHKKVIFKSISPSTQLEISDGKDIIYVNMDNFFDKGDFIHLYENTIDTINSFGIWQKAAQKKYQYYKVFENWCSYADHVVVYGKLIKSSDGFLWIKPTKLAEYPSFICLQQHEELYLTPLAKKISKNTHWLIFDVLGIICCVFGLILIF